jgi:hypothetical protein
MTRRCAHHALLFAALTLAPAPVAAVTAGANSSTAAWPAPAPMDSTSAAAATDAGRLTYLVPELEGAGYRVTAGKDRFARRVAFSPAIGRLGDNDLFSFRIGYSPNTWLGYEVALGHNPAEGLHALLHTFNVVLRHPFSGRIQPYATLGYGMMTVYPGQAINADPVTKNTLTYGGGLELYLRNDVSLRGELRGASVLGQELNSEGTVAYDYREYTIGLAFYRGLGD